LEPRDWIDVLSCDEKLQPLGYLVWAACGKDPGFSPLSLLAEARRSSRYSQTELQSLDFAGPMPDAAALSRQWHATLQRAQHICTLLPAPEAGKCVLTHGGDLCRYAPDELHDPAKLETLKFHPGSIGGTWPRILEQR